MKIKLTFAERFKALFSGSVDITKTTERAKKFQENIKDERDETENALKASEALAKKAQSNVVETKTEEKRDPLNLVEYDQTSALQLLHLLQKHGRLVDFLHEEIDSYSDEEVGAGARIVHAGCQKVLSDYIQLSAIREEKEESKVVIEKDFDTQAVHLVGDIEGEPPYQGVLVHKGWQVSGFNLPKVTDKANLFIINPAEVEL